MLHPFFAPLGAAAAIFFCTLSVSTPLAAAVPVDFTRDIQPIFEARQATAGNLQVTTTLAGGQTLATLTNQAQVGGFAANDQIPALMHLQADNLRRNITVT